VRSVWFTEDQNSSVGRFFNFLVQQARAAYPQETSKYDRCIGSYYDAYSNLPFVYQSLVVFGPIRSGTQRV
jgi:hypothetical protein